MDKLDDPHSLSLILLVIMILFNLLFCNEAIASFKTHFIRRTRSSISVIMHELGRKSSRYYRMSNTSFWKLYDILKHEINKPSKISRRSRKKRKRNLFIPNSMICTSTYLSAVLRVFAGSYSLDIALVHGISYTEIWFSVWKVVDTIHLTSILNIDFQTYYLR